MSQSVPGFDGLKAADTYRLRAGAIALNSAKKYSDAEMTEKAEEFESMFISQMLNHMFEGIETNELFGGGEGEDVYKSFMVDEYAKMIVKTGGIGVADHVKAEMIRMQEMQVGANQTIQE